MATAETSVAEHGALKQGLLSPVCVEEIPCTAASSPRLATTGKAGVAVLRAAGRPTLGQDLLCRAGNAAAPRSCQDLGLQLHSCYDAPENVAPCK